MNKPYDGPERRCTDCPIKTNPTLSREIVEGKNNVVWMRIIGGAMLLTLAWAYLDLRSGMKDSAKQVSDLSVEVAKMGTALDGVKSYQQANEAGLNYLRTRIEAMAFAEKEKIR